MTTTPTPQRPRLRRRRPAALARVSVRALSLALALSLAGAPAQAADIGRARLVSGAGQPLRLVVPVTGLTAAEAATLTVRVAAADAWQQTGLTPPVPLALLRVAVAPGASADQRELRVSAAEPPRGEVVDLLLEVASASGQRRVQLSVIVTRAPTAIGAPVVATQNATQLRATVRVARGDVLWRIARRHQYADTTLYQMLAAFYQSNLAAFIFDNMNLLRSGATLTVPDAASVRAIDAQAALRLFLAHQDAFFRYRAGRGARGEATAATALAAPSAGLAPDQTASDAALPDPNMAGDRLRLSGLAADLAGDEQVARQRAERDAAERVAQLQRNLDDVNRVLQADAQGDPAASLPHPQPLSRERERGADGAGFAPLPRVGEGAPGSGQPGTGEGQPATETAPMLGNHVTNAASSPNSTATTARHGTAAGAAPGATTGSAESLATATATDPATAASGTTTPRANTAANVPATPAVPSAPPLDTALPQATNATSAATTAAVTDSAPSANGQTATAAAAGSPTTPAATQAPAARPRWYAAPPYWLLGLLGLVAALGVQAWFVLRRRRRNAARAQHDAVLRDKFTRQLKDIDLNLDADANADAAADAAPAVTPAVTPTVTATPAPPKP